jgi:hypothetical protein
MFNWYTWIRRIHLIAGLGLLLFTLMYFASGYVIIHKDWFNEPKVETTRETGQLDPNKAPAAADLSRYLQDRYILNGRRHPPKQKDGKWLYGYDRPGFDAEVSYDPATQKLNIRRTTADVRTMVVQMHRLHGYGGGGAYILWALLLDLSSISMITFAVSGICLWFKLERRRRWIGWTLLGLSYGYTAAMVAVQLLSP